METIFTIDIKSSVTKSVLDVFDTMLSLQLEPVQETDAADLKEMRIVGSVNFAGQLSGIIHINVNKNFDIIIKGRLFSWVIGGEGGIGFLNYYGFYGGIKYNF